MSILTQILSEIKTDDVTEKIRSLCDQIQHEENISEKYESKLPRGPNIFLALEVPGRHTKEIGFLTLERESADCYLLVFSTISKLQIRDEFKSCKRRRVWQIDEFKPEKILTELAKKYKFLRGE